MPYAALVNPPFNHPVFRDGYCSGPTKADYSIQPLDLVLQSGWFRKYGYEPVLFDGIFEKTSEEAFIKKICAIKPIFALVLIGQYSFESDRAFIRRLKEADGRLRIFVSGDAGRFNPSGAISAIPELEAVLLDFTGNGIVEYLSTGSTSNLWARGENTVSKAKDLLVYPMPDEGVIRQNKYKLPFFSDPHFYSLLTSYGCPFSCRYCSTNRIGYRERPTSEIIVELKFARELGFKSLYIRDATFFVNRKKTIDLLRSWKAGNYGFQWICFNRPDLLYDEAVGLAAECGCRMMMLGVESFNESVLKRLGREGQPEKVAQGFELLRCHGIMSSANFLIGAAENGAGIKEYKQDLKKGIRKYGPDFISLSLLENRPGTKLGPDDLAFSVKNAKELKALIRQLNFWFYFNPFRILKIAFKISSFSLFRMQAALFIKMIWR